MKIEISEFGASAYLVHLNGKFNMYSVPDFQERLDQTDPASRNFVLHLGGVPHIDSSALGTIIRLQVALQEKGRRLVLAAPSESLMEIFRMTGTATRFQIFADEQEAMAHV